MLLKSYLRTFSIIAASLFAKKKGGGIYRNFHLGIGSRKTQVTVAVREM